MRIAQILRLTRQTRRGPSLCGCLPRLLHRPSQRDRRGTSPGTTSAASRQSRPMPGSRTEFHRAKVLYFRFSPISSLVVAHFLELLLCSSLSSVELQVGILKEKEKFLVINAFLVEILMKTGLSLTEAAWANVLICSLAVVSFFKKFALHLFNSEWKKDSMKTLLGGNLCVLGCHRAFRSSSALPDHMCHHCCDEQHCHCSDVRLRLFTGEELVKSLKQSFHRPIGLATPSSRLFASGSSSSLLVGKKGTSRMSPGPGPISFFVTTELVDQPSRASAQAICTVVLAAG